MRIVKAPDVRRAEILETAKALFTRQGYAGTSVADIVAEAKIAKGTFYYYFKTKSDVLESLAEQMVNEMVLRASKVAEKPDLTAIEKICGIIMQQNQVKDAGGDVVAGLHQVGNKELHDRVAIETVLSLGPVFADVIAQGVRENLFQVDDPLSTIQFILAGADFLLGENTFNWTPEEKLARFEAMFKLIERALGAAPNTVAPALQKCLLRH
ncbi:TetR family transcriptional regulator [Enterobacter sp. BIGb0383]|uniref:TetR/AcrR family transcriptional regulator n=1 Tax=unclassified Enterobacter TaxID=2608935 RepID=UPI000F487D70|nr:MULTISPECIES: TetR/AcrR family transcriptional regulator [unclassified Enterobacter]ROP49430.1 TetR family transcriptional regulator [Enterobacter sp. BIGb0383]ROS00694.1 TetR family transcriptional regulator [Enterobacter sp. BIGb0359]